MYYCDRPFHITVASSSHLIVPRFLVFSQELGCCHDGSQCKHDGGWLIGVGSAGVGAGSSRLDFC